MEKAIEISNFLDSDGRITKLPKKHTVRFEVLKYLASKFETGRDYTEKEINAICEEWHTFGDYFLLRRELVDYKFLNRERNGSRYWLRTENK